MIASVETTRLWLTAIALALVAYFTRFSMVALLGKVTLPIWAQRAFKLTVPAVFMAIVLPGVVTLNQELALNPFRNYRIAAALVAALVAWRTRNMLLTMLAGMGVLWALGWLSGR